MKLKLLCTLSLILISIFYEVNRRTKELDYLHNIPSGSLTLKVQNFKEIELSTFHLQNQKDKLTLSFKDKQIFRDSNQNFLTLLHSKGSIKSDGDAFYEISDIPQKICVDQVITEISNNKDEVLVKGFFKDCEDSNYAVIFIIGQRSLKLRVESHSKIYNRIKVSFENCEDNYYYGLGEQFSHLILGKNRPYSMFVREKGVGRTQQPETMLINFLYGAGGNYYGSYSPSPIWISSRKIGYLLDSYALASWMNNEILVWDNNITLNLFYSDSFKEIVSQISQINGYTDPVTDWVNEGAILGLQGNTASVMEKYKRIKNAGGIVKGLWIQDWVSKRQSLGFSRLWWNWQLDTKHYEGWDKMREQLSEEGVNVLIYMNPMFTNVSTKESYVRNFYEEGMKNNHFIKLKDGKVFQTSAFSDYTAALIDFDNPKGAQFYQSIVKEALKSTGASGMMVDFSEAYPVENIHNSLEEAVKFHNQYPVKYHKKVRQVFDSLPNKENIYSFSRAGYLRAPKYTHSLWAGDQSMNFKKHTGLPSCLTAMISSGLIGYSNTHCDIGGYTFFEIWIHPTSSRTYILLQRWLQLSAFSPVFRSHEGNKPEKTLQIYSDDETLSDFAFYSNIYVALANYRKKQAKLSQQLRIPLVRAMFLQYKDDPEVFKISDQYYLGDDILVSPLLTPNNQRKLYLPNGKWVNIWNREQVDGCNCYVTSQSYLPPVYIKEQSEDKDQILQKVSEIVKNHKRVDQTKDKNTQKDL